MKPISIYNAGEIFSEGQIFWRKHQGRVLRERFGDAIDLYNPIDAPFNEDKDAAVPTPQAIYEGDFLKLQVSDVLLFDYSETDDPGVSCEIGIMAQRVRQARENGESLPLIIGILSDSRRGTANAYPNYPAPPVGVNHMVLGLNLSEGSIVVHSFAEAMDVLERLIAERSDESV